MVAIKANQANSFLAKPDRAVRSVLLFGPDQGLVSERAQKLGALLAGRETPPGEVIRLDDADLDGDPEKLAVELLTVPMFGGPKIVRASAGRRITAALLAPLIEGAPPGGYLIVEAGNLRADDKLRALFEKSAAAAAIGCYADEGVSLDGLISEVVGAARMTIAPDARAELAARLGADRALSRAEVEKLVLYALGAKQIEIGHVEAIVGDAADLAVDEVVAAAAGGEAAVALREADRAVASGESAQTILLAAERHFQRLHRLKAGMEAGRSFDDVTRAMRPPLPFKARGAIERQCRQWTEARLGAALRRISEGVRQSRTTGADEAVLAERVLIEIARLARLGAPASRG